MAIPPRDEALTKLTIGARYNGPVGSANGGYVGGLLAGRLGAPAARVTLRVPPPLETPLTVESAAGDTLRLLDGDTLVAEATPATAPDPEVDPVPLDVAEEATARYRGFAAHPFPTCFTCGTDREPGDGLRLFAGPVPGGDGTVVSGVWTPDPALVTPAPPGTVPPEIVWAALDCPGGWSSDVVERPMVLGRMTAAITAPPEAGRPHVVMGRLTGTEGRKVFTASALYDDTGALLATAVSTWITIRR